MLNYILASLFCSIINISYLFPAIKNYGGGGWKWKFISFETANLFLGPIMTIVLLYNLKWWIDNYDS